MSDRDRSAWDRHWMRRALALAERAAAAGEVPVGAVLILGEGERARLLGEGRNETIARCDPSAHAEINALRAAAVRQANHRLPGAVLYVTVEPCTMCAGALVQARVRRVVFGAREPRTGALVSRARVLDSPAHNHRVELCEGVLAKECAERMQRFFRQRRLAAGKLSQSENPAP